MNHQPPIIIGERSDWGDPQPFGISAVDRRQHMYVIGKTGSGKTTLLRNMMAQHIALGHGVGLIDPHGDLAEELLHHIPPARADHLAYFNPGDLDFPIGMNPLANVAPDDRHIVASGLVAAFKGIWRDSWGPRLEYILYNAVSALLDCRDATLLGVNRLLVDEKYRPQVIRQIKDPFIRAFWTEEYAGYDPRFQREAIAPIQNKLGQSGFFSLASLSTSSPWNPDNSRSAIALTDVKPLFYQVLSKQRADYFLDGIAGISITNSLRSAAIKEYFIAFGAGRSPEGEVQSQISCSYGPGSSFNGGEPLSKNAFLTWLFRDNMPNPNP